MVQHLQRTLRHRSEKGASAVEYGLLVFAIAALIVVIVVALGGIVTELFDDTCDSFAGQHNSTSC